MGSCYRCCGLVVNFLRLGQKDAPSGLEKYGKNYYLREPCIWTVIHVFGVTFGYGGLALLILSLLSDQWMETPQFRGGLFSHCIENVTHGTFDITKPCTEDSFPKWQNSVICLVFFACFFIFTGALLSTVGLVTISLPEKLYFYHSTAECFFTGTIGLQLGLVTWICNGGPSRLSMVGFGFLASVAAVVLFFISTTLMALDDIIGSCRTTVLYTDEMASIYASAGKTEQLASAMTSAADAFASAGAAGAGATRAGAAGASAAGAGAAGPSAAPASAAPASAEVPTRADSRPNTLGGVGLPESSPPNVGVAGADAVAPAFAAAAGANITCVAPAFGRNDSMYQTYSCYDADAVDVAAPGFQSHHLPR